MLQGLLGQNGGVKGAPFLPLAAPDFNAELHHKELSLTRACPLQALLHIFQMKYSNRFCFILSQYRLQDRGFKLTQSH